MTDQRHNRLDRLMKSVSEAGADAVLITSLPNVSYLTGFSGSSGFVLATKDRAWFMTDSRYETQSAEEVSGYDIVIQKGRWTSEVATLARDARISKLMFEGRHVSVETHEALAKGLEGVDLLTSRDAVERLRMIKDEQEVEYITEAVRRAEHGFLENASRLASGMAEKDTAIGLEFNIRAAGARKVPFDIIVASGYRAALPHGIASDKIMAQGDTVIVDFGGEAYGYQSDLTRSGVIGRPDSKQAEVYDIVAEAQRRAIDAVKPGAACKDIDLAARDYISSKGYGNYFGHGLGHGVGLEVHEGPSVSYLSEDTVQPGMVFTIEPGIYIPGWGGYRIEDMVFATEDGCKLMTSLSRAITF